MKHDVPTATIFAGAAKPLTRALKLLAPDFGEIRAAWVKRLESFSVSPDHVEALSGIIFQTQMPYLREGNFDAYKLAIERRSEELAGLGIPEEHAVVAVAHYLESCLAHLSPATKDRGRMEAALVRLASAAQLFLLSGYAGRRASGWRALDEQERHRLSRDLHDDIGHSLVVLKLYLEMITMDLEKGKAAQVDQKIKEAMVLVSTAVQSVRRLILDLGPAVLEEVGFVQAVKLYARQFATRTDIKVQVQDSPLPQGVPASYETALYRVVQGALSNVIKHAHASNVKITLGSMRDSVIVMVIEDDGVGFAVDSKRPHQAFGLSAIRDRIRSLGGRVHIESAPARAGKRGGTKIEVDLPLVERRSEK